MVNTHSSFTGSKARQIMRTFTDTSRDFGERIAETEDRLLGETACSARDADTEILVAVHHHTVVRLDEEVGHARGNIREQPGGIAATQETERELLCLGNCWRHGSAYPIKSALPRTR